MVGSSHGRCGRVRQLAAAALLGQWLVRAQRCKPPLAGPVWPLPSGVRDAGLSQRRRSVNLNQLRQGLDQPHLGLGFFALRFGRRHAALQLALLDPEE